MVSLYTEYHNVCVATAWFSRMFMTKLFNFLITLLECTCQDYTSTYVNMIDLSTVPYYLIRKPLFLSSIHLTNVHPAAACLALTRCSVTNSVILYHCAGAVSIQTYIIHTQTRHTVVCLVGTQRRLDRVLQTGTRNQSSRQYMNESSVIRRGILQCPVLSTLLRYVCSRAQ